MTTEKDYKDLSRYVYYLDPKHKNYDSRIKEEHLLRGENVDYQILKTADNTSNGMQAMAVAPFKNGKVDTSEVVIAYAGTNPSDVADIQTVISGNKEVLIIANGHLGYGGYASTEI